jgi:hypothetical protein
MNLGGTAKRQVSASLWYRSKWSRCVLEAASKAARSPRRPPIHTSPPTASIDVTCRSLSSSPLLSSSPPPLSSCNLFPVGLLPALASPSSRRGDTTVW